MVTCCAQAILPACHTILSIGIVGAVATLGMAAFVIALGDD